MTRAARKQTVLRSAGWLLFRESGVSSGLAT